jgi:choline dehydrogenase-like flavoprotein
VLKKLLRLGAKINTRLILVVNDKRAEHFSTQRATSYSIQISSTTQYTSCLKEIRIVLALEALQNDEELSLRAATKLYNILVSTDPLANPFVDFRAATDPNDLDVAVALVQKAWEIMDAPSMRVLGPNELPFGRVVQTNEKIKQAIQQTFNPSNGHECCTAAMMPTKLGGVVNDQLKVNGVDGLRVADIGFWPMALNGGPSATVYASAEKVRLFPW